MKVSILSVGTAVPAGSFPQAEILSFARERFNIRDRTRQLYERVFTNPSVGRRHFALEQLDEVLDQRHDHKNARFEREAAALAKNALLNALTQARLSPASLDYLVAATCTGYICPGLSSHLIELCDLNPNVHVADLVGMGCGAAIPALEQACHFALAHPGKTAAVVCAEVCSAAMVSNDDPGIVVSNALFADGAAAVVVRADPLVDGLVVRRFAARTIPALRHTLRFVSDNGHLTNRLERDVPVHAAGAVRAVVSELLGEHSFAPVNRWVLHAGGQKVLDALSAELRLNETDIAAARTVLRDYGNMSSPTVLFVLDRMMKSGAFSAGETAVMASFGAGFSAYAALLEWV